MNTKPFITASHFFYIEECVNMLLSNIKNQVCVSVLINNNLFMASSKIRVLNDHTINKIAAGEVIENPSSVVKELVENSLDAGAQNICVEIKEGGRQLIRITDDGCGMNGDDALLCLERHATSKIKEVEDIQDLVTMGFRGEALPSIAAISKFTLLTSHCDEEKKESGSFIIVEGGRILSHAPAPRSHGTTIEVKSLFFNVPVRRKFQKSPTYDAQEILKVLNLFALAYPSVRFELISDQKSLLKTPSASTALTFHEQLERRLEPILGKEYASSLIPLKFQQDPYEMVGFIGLPTFHKPNRTGQHLFINQRLVTSPFIAAAIREGYGPMLPNQRYPVFILHLHMPGSLLDVNVHPQKKEVRLRQEYQLKEALLQSIQAALRQEQSHFSPPLQEEGALIPPFWAPYASLLSPSFRPPSTSEEKWEYQPVTSNTESQFISSLESETSQPSHSSQPSYSSQFSHSSQPPHFTSHSQRNQTLIPTAVKAAPTSSPSSTSFIVGVAIPKVLATIVGYCILESFAINPQLMKISSHYKEGGLVLLDQRAAYSRIHYEKLLKRSSKNESQSLLIPLTLQVSSSEYLALSDHMVLLNEMGFGLREFGDKSMVIDAYPSFLKQDELQFFLTLLMQDLVEIKSSRRLQMKKEEQLALAASRASIPQNKQLSLEEAQTLVQQLLQCELPAQCPLGKPICLYLSSEELTKLFQKKENL